MPRQKQPLGLTRKRAKVEVQNEQGNLIQNVNAAPQQMLYKRSPQTISIN